MNNNDCAVITVNYFNVLKTFEMSVQLEQLHLDQLYNFTSIGTALQLCRKSK